MPEYTYYCSLCQQEHSVIKKISEFEREEKCPACESDMTRQPPTKTSFVLKGPSWFRDGYGGK